MSCAVRYIYTYKRPPLVLMLSELERPKPVILSFCRSPPLLYSIRSRSQPIIHRDRAVCTVRNRERTLGVYKGSGVEQESQNGRRCSSGRRLRR